ncbi:MAG: hypothetical protein RLY58_1061 [Pseudomonadota bacterium]|jgi:hypothetical protein
MPATSTLAHAHGFDAASLYLVKPEIDVSLHQVESALSIFVDDEHNTAGLMDAADAMMQIHGILRLLDLHGASQLSGAMGRLLRDIAENPAQTREDRLSAIGEGLMVLSRYLEFVLLRDTPLPTLLLPVTNTLNQLAGLPLLREGHFLLPQLTSSALTTAQLPPSTLDSTHQHSLRTLLNRMYRTGLSAVLANQAQARDYALMQRATAEAYALAAGTPAECYWQAAASAVEHMADCRPLTSSRKRVLAAIERRFVHADATPSTEDISDVLALGLCRDHSNAQALRHALNLDDIIVTDQRSTELSRYLFGPDGEVIHTVSALVHDEIATIKNFIDTIARGEPLEGGFTLISERMQILAHTLDMLNLNDAARELSAHATMLGTWTQAPDQERLNGLMDTLLAAENAMTLLDKSYTPGTVMLPLNNMRISLHQLDAAREMLISESRGTLSGAMRSLLSFIESNGDMLHMDNVPQMLESVSGAMQFLNAPRGRDILKSTATYISGHFGPDQEPPSLDKIERLADAITCIDYYLESMEVKKPAGDRPFTIGERSLAVLGAA